METQDKLLKLIVLCTCSVASIQSVNLHLVIISPVYSIPKDLCFTSVTYLFFPLLAVRSQNRQRDGS